MDDLQAYLFWLLLILKWIQKNLIDTVLSLTIGYTTKHGWNSEKKNAGKFENSAQTVKIRFRAHYSCATLHGPINFLYAHQKYSSPNDVLGKDNITLMVIQTSN
jgi:hypothetical protein